MGCIHFIGMRGPQRTNAELVFGPPDFEHMCHDHRMYGDVDLKVDTLVFGRRARPSHIEKYSDQDHERN